MASGAGTGRDSDKYMLRFEGDLRPKMKQLAQQHDRTLNAEINVAIKAHISGNSSPVTPIEACRISTPDIERIAVRVASVGIRDGFFSGVCTALAILRAHGDAGSTAWWEIVNSAGRKELEAYAVKSEQWMLCGFEQANNK